MIQIQFLRNLEHHLVCGETGSIQRYDLMFKHSKITRTKQTWNAHTDNCNALVKVKI